jgi:DNA-binding NarL/FixJ family response regulator
VSAAIQAAPNLHLHTVASTLKQALTALSGPTMDVLLVDLGLPDGSGIDMIRAAHKKWPACSIMVFTTFGDEQHVMQSLQAGATGYLIKDSSEQSITTEIRNLYQGGSPISPLIARQILIRFMHPPQPLKPTDNTHRVSLSPREMEVLQLITKGFNYDEIAALLSVSRHTVLTFVRRTYNKLEVNSKAAAIYEARQLGLLHD